MATAAPRHHYRVPSGPNDKQRPSSSQSGKKSGHKHHRPAPLTRKHTSEKAQKLGGRREIEEEDDDPMAVTFLQYCATCEKQILVPHDSILYCSESCRRKDKESLPALDPNPSPPLTPFASLSLADDTRSPRDIVPQASPRTPSFNQTFPIIDTSASSDDEPVTLPRTSSSDDPTMTVGYSAAAQSLKQLQSSTSGRSLSIPSIKSVPSSPNLPRASAAFLAPLTPHRPSYPRSNSSTSSISSSSTYTASGAASSTIPAGPSSSAAYHKPSTSTSYIDPGYSFATRPLPPRHNPSFSHAAAAPRSIDLVTPHTFSMTPAVTGSPAHRRSNTAGPGNNKRWSVAGLDLGSAGASKQLFCFEQMQSQPRR